MRKLTITDVLTSLVLCCVIVGGCLPSMGRASETANRVKCQSNLSQMGKALLLYSNENGGAYPQAYYVPDQPVSVSNDGHAETNPFITSRLNNIPAAMFLLIRTQDMTTEVFTCPSGTSEKDLMDGESALKRSNFTGDSGLVLKNVSYSFFNVYPSNAALLNGYPKLITAFGSDFAVAADRAPAAPCVVARVTVGAPRSVMIKGNSKNHDQDGQNVLYADGHAEFQQTPLCGMNNDHIYTSQSFGVDPVSGSDSVLLISEK